MNSFTGTVFELFQFLSLILAGATLGLSIKRGVSNRLILLDIPMILLMAHGIFYYVMVFLTRYELLTHPGGSPFTFWSTALRFHGYATLFIIVLTSYLRERQLRKYGRTS